MDIQLFLQDLKQFGKENMIPNITETNAKFLQDVLKIKKPKQALEIGTANWYSAIQMWIILQKYNGKLTSIEFSSISFWKADENVRKVGLEWIIYLINGNALEVIPQLNEKYDFVFIDGMKRRTKDFLELVWDKVANEWIIIIDDVIKFKEKMIWLWEYLEEQHIDYNIIPIDGEDGILMIVKG